MSRTTHLEKESIKVGGTKSRFAIILLAHFVSEFGAATGAGCRRGRSR